MTEQENRIDSYSDVQLEETCYCGAPCPRWVRFKGEDCEILLCDMHSGLEEYAI